MRRLALLIALATTAGCQPDCGLPTTALGGVRFQAFGNVIDWETGETGAPPGQTLINGYTDLEFEFTDLSGPIVVRINDQPFDGEGTWNTVECGNFTASFGGTFRSIDGSDHSFTAAGNFFLYDVFIEGAMAWNETWTSADGTAIGSLAVADGSVTGRQYAPGE